MRQYLQSLRGLTIAFLALFLAVTLAAGFGTFFATLSMVNQLVDQRISSESHALAPIGRRMEQDQLVQQIAQMASARETGDLGVLLTDAQGRRMAGNARFTRPLPLGFSSLDLQDRIEGLSEGRVLVRDIGDGMRLAVFAETEPIDDYFSARRRIYIAGFGSIICVVLVGLLLFRRLVGARIEQVRLTAESIIEGDLSRRVPLLGDDGEFDRQAAAFNHMLDRMSMLMTQMRNVSNDISHELRTPLAKLRNELALLGQREETAPIGDALVRATEQADELLAMFGSMLRIAAIESGARRAGFEQLALHELVTAMVEIILPLAQDKRQTVTITELAPVILNGDRQLLSQMLLNLLENALRHTPPETAIVVSLRHANGHALLCVADNGPGIRAEQRALAMRRFGRLDASRHRTGHGLGLPLAAAIAQLHHATLVLEDAAPGLRIIIAIPT